MDEGTPVTEDYTPSKSGFTGKILKVKVDVKPMGAGEKAAASQAAVETAEKVDAAN
jgi:hypothetical protein